MEMESLTASPGCMSPYTTAPSSPRRFPPAPAGNFFYSAPTSPARAAALIDELAAVPFIWEEKHGGKEADAGEEEADDGDEDFAFDFSGHLETKSLTADELFDGGKIKPLKPPPRCVYDPLESPKSPARTIREALSPRHRKKDFDPFAAALERARRESVRKSVENRGRERSKKPSPNKSSRSLSPFRVSDLLYDPDLNQKPPKSSPFSFLPKKWRIKDLLLFRSASESRATDDQQMKKHAILRNARLKNVKSSSSLSAAGTGSTSSRRISAHEMHYTVNRAVSEELKKRTFLPYKQTLLSCLGFHPSVTELSRTLSPIAARSST